MLVLDTELRFINDQVGVGVFAKRRIPKGTIVWVQDPMDSVYTMEELQALNPVLQRQMLHYSYMDHTQHMVLCWDMAKYFNHSCESTCLGLDFPFEMAVRDIEAGEQLTDDYATFHLSANECFECQCGSPSCRHTVSPENVEQMMPVWSQRLKDALALVHDVPQPLMSMMPEGVLEQVMARFAAQK